MSKKTKTTSDSNTVVAPTNPTQVTNGLTGMANTITGLQGADPYSFTAGADPLQTQAATAAGGLGSAIPGAQTAFNTGIGNATGITGNVAGATAPQMTAATAYGGIDHYMDRYLNDVVKSSLAGFDQNAGLQTAKANLDQAQDSTFGGSGGSIYKALLGQGQALSRGQLESGLRSQGFGQALQYANADADRSQKASQVNAGLSDSNLTRQLAAGGQLGNLANMGLTGNLAVDQNGRANIDTQAQQGEIMRQILLQHNVAPLSVAGTIAGLWGSTPFGLLHGENDTSHSTSTQTVSDPMGQIGSLMAGAGAFGTGLGALGIHPFGPAAAVAKP